VEQVAVGGDAVRERQQLGRGDVVPGARLGDAVVVGGEDGSAEVDRDAVGPGEPARDDLAGPAVGVQLRDPPAGVAGDEHAVPGVEGRVVQPGQSAGQQRPITGAEQVDAGDDAGDAAGKHLEHAAAVEPDGDRLVHAGGDELRRAAVHRDPEDLAGEHVRVVEGAVRAELHGVAHGQPAGEHHRLRAAQLEQPSTGDHLVDEQAVADAGDPVRQPHLVGDQGDRGVGVPSPHAPGHEIRDVHRPVRTEGEVVGGLHRPARGHHGLDVTRGQVDGADLAGQELGDVQPSVRAEGDAVRAAQGRRPAQAAGAEAAHAPARTSSIPPSSRQRRSRSWKTIGPGAKELPAGRGFPSLL
jgi:hypothetical protein